MPSSTQSIRVAGVTAALACLLGTAGCGNSATPTAPAAGSVPTSPATASPSSTGSASVSASAQASSSAAPAGGNCAAGELKATLVRGDSAAGSTFYKLTFTNTGNRECTLQGTPGVSFVTGDQGTQVGPAATREAKAQGALVTLRPGGTTSSELRFVRADLYDAAQCKPVQVRGLRVYPPGDTGALFVDFPQQACSAGSQSQLSAKVVG